MPRTIFDQRNANSAKPPISFSHMLITRKENRIVDYIVVILAIAMVGLYALLIGWLLPKH